jgi:hypothetical protein
VCYLCERSTTTEDKTEDKKVSVMIQNVQSISSISTKLEILSEGLSLEVSREYTFRSVIWNDEISNDNDNDNDNVARIAILAIS